MAAMPLSGCGGAAVMTTLKGTVNGIDLCRSRKRTYKGAARIAADMVNENSVGMIYLYRGLFAIVHYKLGIALVLVVIDKVQDEKSLADQFPETMADAENIVALKTDVYKKAHNALLLCLDNKLLREVNKEDSVAGVWLKLETLYMTKSLANKLYLKKKLFTFYMHSGKKLSEHIDEFNKLISDLANKDVDIDDEDQALMLLSVHYNLII
ncbi:hypothetical protein Tco_0459308 [Tanacetum coccineum]